MNIKRILNKFYYLYVKRDTVAYARHLGVKVGDHCQILTDPAVAFGTEPWLITLGDHVDVTEGVHFLCHEGGMWCARELENSFKSKDLFSPIKVGNNVMIGLGSLIMPGVTIGNNVIIGGHSVVTKDVPDGAIVAGMPAKQISTVDSFVEKLHSRKMFETKGLSQEQKRAYLQKNYPELFL